MFKGFERFLRILGVKCFLGRVLGVFGGFRGYRGFRVSGLREFRV